MCLFSPLFWPDVHQGPGAEDLEDPGVLKGF